MKRHRFLDKRSEHVRVVFWIWYELRSAGTYRHCWRCQTWMRLLENIWPTNEA